MRLVALLILFAATLLAADKSTFAYDQDLALDVREHEVAIRNGIRVALLNFRVTPSVRVVPSPSRMATTLFAVPSGTSMAQLSTSVRSPSATARQA